MIYFLLVSLISNAQTKWTNASVPVGVCAERVGQVLNLKEVRPKDRTDPFAGKKVYRYDRPGFCDFAEVIDSARRTGEPVYLTRRGRAVAVVVDPDVFNKLIDDAEDAIDHAELALARDEDDYIPWEQVKADLGLS
jgi:prevent-host-death family protein